MSSVVGILIKDKRLLFVRTIGSSIFTCPGDEIKTGESKERVLIRTLKDQLTITTNPKDFVTIGTYKLDLVDKVGAAEEVVMLMVLHYEGAIRAHNKVEEIVWIDSFNDAACPLGGIYEKHIIPELKSKKLIN